MAFVGNIGVAAAVYVGTNLDNLLLLLLFYSNQRFTPRQVALGNFISGLVLIVGGLVCGLAAYSLPTAVLSWLGVVPLGLGCWQLMALIRRKPSGDKMLMWDTRWNALAVTVICMAHGADNVMVYGALFATSSPAACLSIVMVFVVMIAIFNRAGRGLVEHPTAGRYLRRVAGLVTPLVLIGFGLWILSRPMFR